MGIWSTHPNTPHSFSFYCFCVRFLPLLHRTCNHLICKHNRVLGLIPTRICASMWFFRDMYFLFLFVVLVSRNVLRDSKIIFFHVRKCVYLVYLFANRCFLLIPIIRARWRLIKLGSKHLFCFFLVLFLVVGWMSIFCTNWINSDGQWRIFFDKWKYTFFLSQRMENLGT
jgi:hypothetical protein